MKTATAAFGSLFNNITIKRKDGKTIPVPISYGPRSKWLEAANKTDDNEMFEKLLPRMSYEMVAMNYDSNRKLTNKQFMRSEPLDSSSSRIKVPVPYNLDFTLYIQTKNMNDGWQIIEQILPFFTPAYTVRIRHFPATVYNDSELVSPTNAYDIPFTLTAVVWADDYAGSMYQNRAIEWTLEFTTKIHLFGPADGVPGLSKVIYDARAVVSTPAEIGGSIYEMDRTTPQVGGETGWVSSDSEIPQFDSDLALSPFVVNNLMDSDGIQVRVIREFEV
ncbi:MAG: tail sheath stabilizer and completion protein [Candidatus Thiodiazotropha endolucinida]|uniref:Tail sheath stabilizer and completion protein n=1 Tax=Candidatus Thiodiazotropha taylori TaxID=2792791 RepID=A0A9E4N2K7_9GAMM|nr:tail sheath stabilizer and completion protein [Candidatus Thiodiazotropha taylori]